MLRPRRPSATASRPPARRPAPTPGSPCRTGSSRTARTPPCLARMLRQRPRHRVGGNQPRRRHEQEQRRHQPGQPAEARARIDRQRNARHRRQPVSRPQQPLAAEPHHQAHVDEVQHHQPDDPGPEQQPVILRRQMVVFDIGERRPGDVGEGAAEEAPGDPHEAEQPPLPQQPAVARERRPQRLGVAPPGRQRIGQRGQRPQRQHAHPDQRPEDRPPPGHRQDLPAQHRPEQRGDRHHHHQRGHHLRRPVAGIQVAHHGAAQHHARASPQRLHHAPGDHRTRAPRQAAPGGADHEQHQPDCNRPTPAIPVANRPPQQLPEAEADQVTGDGEVDRARIRPQRHRHRRQRRQVEIGRDRGEGQQRAQHRKHAPALPLIRQRRRDGLSAQ